MPKIIICIVFLLSIAFSCNTQPDKLIACGSNKVIIVKINNLKDTIEPKLLWEWVLFDAKSLPKEYQENYFNKIDECKPVNNGNEIMITASSGGVAIIDRTTKDVVFYGFVANAHSIEELPDNRIAVAGSNHEKGNCIAIFNKKSFGEKPIYLSELYAGHGLVWDKRKQLLYALGGNVLQAYTLVDWSSKLPKIQFEEQWGLPDIGGHDLVNYNSEALLVTTNNNVWTFNKSLGSFEVFKPLNDQKLIKGISVSESGDRRIVFIRAEEKWWSHNIYLTNPDEKITNPSINLYKVRWWNYD